VLRAAGSITTADLEVNGFFMTLVRAALAEHAATPGAKSSPTRRPRQRWRW